MTGAGSGLRRAALAHIADQPAHPYAVWRKLVAEGHANPTSPRSVYSTLTRLEAAGLVTSQRELHGPRPGRRIYTITRKGRHALEQ